MSMVLPRDYDNDRDGRPDRRDFDLGGFGEVVVTNCDQEGGFNAVQFDLGGDGTFEVAWLDLDPRDRVFEINLYDVHRDGIADLARVDVNFDGEFEQAEVFKYDRVDGLWKGAGLGSPKVLPLPKSGSFFPLQLLAPFCSW
jgi:hypothetical protein